MRIGMDGKPLLPPRGGVARYVDGLLRGLVSLAAPDLELEVVRPERARRTLPWVLWDLQRATGRGFHAFHFPFYYPPLAPSCPVTVAVHDVLFLQHPEWFPEGRWNPMRGLVPRGVRRAAAVVASAEANARAIVETCRVPRERIRVIPYGLDRTLFVQPPAVAVAAVRARLGLSRPYLLQLGPFEPRRGVDLAIAATAALRAVEGDLELVLAGELRAPVAALADPPEWVRRPGLVADGELPALLAGAEAVLAPSRGEGFDLPVLEALACGAAVAASDIAVHRELFAPAVELFPTGDAEGLAAAVRRLRDDTRHRTELCAAGLTLAATFTWERAAEAHVALWREVSR